MLTLIRGKARKSTLMNTMYCGTEDSIYVCIRILGNDSPLTQGDLIYDIPHNSHLRNLLVHLIEESIEDNKVVTLFIYGNFGNEEVEIIKDVHTLVDGRLNLVVSVDDRTILHHHLVVEEIY